MSATQATGRKYLASSAAQITEQPRPQFTLVCSGWEGSVFFRSDGEPGARPSSFQKIKRKHYSLGGCDFIWGAENKLSGGGSNNNS